MKANNILAERLLSTFQEDHSSSDEEGVPHEVESQSSPDRLVTVVQCSTGDPVCDYISEGEDGVEEQE